MVLSSLFLAFAYRLASDKADGKRASTSLWPHFHHHWKNTLHVWWPGEAIEGQRSQGFAAQKRFVCAQNCQQCLRLVDSQAMLWRHPWASLIPLSMQSPRGQDVHLWRLLHFQLKI